MNCPWHRSLPSNTDSRRTKSDGLQHVGRPTNPAVDKDFKVWIGEHVALLEFIDNLYEDFNTGSGEFLMIGKGIRQRSGGSGSCDVRVVDRCIVTQTSAQPSEPIRCRLTHGYYTRANQIISALHSTHRRRTHLKTTPCIPASTAITASYTKQINNPPPR